MNQIEIADCKMRWPLALEYTLAGFGIRPNHNHCSLEVEGASVRMHIFRDLSTSSIYLFELPNYLRIDPSI